MQSRKTHFFKNHSTLQPHIGGRFASIPLTTRFWSKVNKRGPWAAINGKRSRCWVWTAGCTNGRPVIRINGKNEYAYRVAYRLVFKKRFPTKMFACHKCNNGAVGCINPYHLYPGNHRTNAVDAVRIDRLGKKLTVAKVHSIRQRWAEELHKQGGNPKGISARLCKEFDVTGTSIDNVITRKCWGAV